MSLFCLLLFRQFLWQKHWSLRASKMFWPTGHEYTWSSVHLPLRGHLSKLRAERSRLEKLPSRSSSAIPRPTAGPCSGIGLQFLGEAPQEKAHRLFGNCFWPHPPSPPPLCCQLCNSGTQLTFKMFWSTPNENYRANWRLAQMNNFHGKTALVGSLAFSISILKPIFQLCSNTDQVWGSWFVNPLSEVSKSFYGNQQLLFSPDRWAYHPTHGRPISISLILILVFLGFWNTLSSIPIIT